MNDSAAFALYNRGETIGLFQMESGGMTSLSKQLDVKKLDDIIALIALYRPGPMELIPEYVRAKKGDHANQILASAPRGHLRRPPTAVMIYQEQVDGCCEQTCRLLACAADLLRRLMGKKEKEKMAKERRNFIEGCAQTNKIPEKKANAIFRICWRNLLLRIQQESQRGVWRDQLPNGLPQSAIIRWNSWRVC